MAVAVPLLELVRDVIITKGYQTLKGGENDEIYVKSWCYHDETLSAWHELRRVVADFYGKYDKWKLRNILKEMMPKLEYICEVVGGFDMSLHLKPSLSALTHQRSVLLYVV